MEDEIESMNEEMNEMESMPQAESYNKVEIPEQLAENMNEGDDAEVSVTGKVVVKPDGSKCIEVSSINGIPLAEGEAEPEKSEEEIAVEAKQSSKDLVGKLKEMNKGKENMYS